MSLYIVQTVKLFFSETENVDLDGDCYKHNQSVILWRPLVVKRENNWTGMLELFALIL